ncbi:MAG: cbb3-type cytochrome c oxidase subunit 3 [Myxococcales bacterium]|nr:cbb3-type cytochrome c oxidase subunit 3 [Myxococcales bacterium]MCB9712333.1 cbb3-type cytochrome c oxidase subunit 3 [Myxococcales bacterium]
MKNEILSRTDLLFLPELSLVLFLLIFVGALVWIFRPGAKAAYERRSRLPLLDDEIES